MKRKFVVKLLIVTSFFFLSINKSYSLSKGAKNFFLAPLVFNNDSLSVEQNIRKIDNLINDEKNYGKALESALNLFSFTKLTDYQKFRIAFKIGLIYNKTNNFNKSLEFYKAALNIYNNNSKSLDNLTVKNFEEKEYLRTLLRIGGSYQLLNNFDSAKIYYKIIEDFPSFKGEIESIKAVTFSNLSGIYEVDSVYDKAEYYSRKSIEIHSRRGEKNNHAQALNNLGNLYLSQGKYMKSKEIYLRGIGLIETDNSEAAVRNKASLYFNLAWAMRNLKEYKAYDALYDSYEIKDELRRRDIQQIVETVSRKHNVDIVKKQAEIDAAKASRNTWVLVGTGILIIVTLSFLLYSYKTRQKNLALKLKRNEAEKQRELSQLKAESQSLILNAALDGKESERKEIAETLHDNVSTLLSSANLHLQACKTQFNGNTPEEVHKTQNIIIEASQKIRDLSHTLVSSVLLKFGLSFAIKDLLSKYSNSQITFGGNIDNIPRFDKKFEIKIYNIIQELLNNILKHSEATRAFIELKKRESNLYVKISDNGKGFDKSKISVKNGIGLSQIDARVQMMTGKMRINSTLNEGTVIEITLPILHETTLNRV